MHCQLSRLNETSQAHLLQILGRRAPAMDAKGVANTLYGLAGMQIFSWRELPAETQLNLDRALSATLLHMAPKDIDSTLYA